MVAPPWGCEREKGKKEKDPALRGQKVRGGTAPKTGGKRKRGRVLRARK